MADGVGAALLHYKLYSLPTRVQAFDWHTLGAIAESSTQRNNAEITFHFILASGPWPPPPVHTDICDHTVVFRHRFHHLQQDYVTDLAAP